MMDGGWSKGGMLCAWARKKSPAGKLPFTIISLKKYTGGKLRYCAGDSEKEKLAPNPLLATSRFPLWLDPLWPDR